MEGVITGAFARALEADRDRFNARFAMARRSTPRLDPAAFTEHLRVTVSPIVEAVHKASPEKVSGTVDALYDVSLDLIGRDMLGPQSRYPSMNEGWNSLLPEVGHLIAVSPRPVIAAVSNMLYNLSVMAGTRPSEWVEVMKWMAPYCNEDVPLFMQAGEVVAWRCGMAQYRGSALQTCRKMDPGWVRAALGIPDSKDAPAIDEILTRIENDPWLHPSHAALADDGKQLRIVAVVGAFRGFGGQLISPPGVTLSDGQFMVSDSENSWALYADAYGSVMLRNGPAMPGKKKPAGQFSIGQGGKVSAGKITADFPELQDFTSFTSNDTTLAVTLSASHSVYLVAMQ